MCLGLARAPVSAMQTPVVGQDGGDRERPSDVLHTAVVRPLITHPREDGTLFVSKRSPSANRFRDWGSGEGADALAHRT